MKKALSVIGVLVLISGCNLGRTYTPESSSLSSTKPKGQKVKPGKSEETSRFESLTLLGTNDIHGALAATELKTRESNGASPIPYPVGGVAHLAAYIRAARAEYPNLVWLDGGDQFQGTLESNEEEGAPMVQFFNAVGLTASAVGNHEFDFGPVGREGTPGDLKGALKARMAEARYKYLAANIAAKDPSTRPLGDAVLPSTIVRVGERLKLGIIGLSTVHTPTTTRPEFVTDLDFLALHESTVREAELLRSQGAHVIAVVAHAGLFCETAKGTFGLRKRKPSDPQGPCKSEEIYDLLQTLPAGTVDAVVSGHTHSVVHHYVAGVPVIQAGGQGRNINLIHLTYDFERGKVVNDKTIIEGPIQTCHQFFANQGDCDGFAPAPAKGRGDLIPATYLGQEIHPDPQIIELFKDLFAKYEAKKSEVVAHAHHEIGKERTAESAMGNLITDALREKAGVEIALTNPGGIRAPIDAGPITFGEIYTTLPFDNFVAVLNVKGSELMNILRIAYSEPGSVYPMSGLFMTLLNPRSPAPYDDLNGNQQADVWEYNRMVSVLGSDKKALEMDRLYTVALPDFLISGGDNMGWAMQQIPAERLKYTTYGFMRDAVVDYVMKRGTINTQVEPLVDPSNPRVKFLPVD